MRTLLFILLLNSCSFLFAQYEIKSPYLITPELTHGYVDSCAQFWIKTWDNSRGGFYTNIDRYGNTPWGTEKDMITQARNAYGFVKAFQMTGNEDYLTYAKDALLYMDETAWDDDYLGWFRSVNENGQPQNTGEPKEAFYQHYALLGLTTYYAATLDNTIKEMMDKSTAFTRGEMWDNSDDFGYYHLMRRDLSYKFQKSFNATVDAITTHILQLYLLTEDDYWGSHMDSVAMNMTDHLVTSMDQQAIGFAEEYTTDWQINESETLTIMGHVLKTAWCLARVNYFYPNEEYINDAELLIQEVLDKGYDHEYGAPYKDYNRVTGEMQMWGNPDTTKAWWQIEQAITAGLMMYDVTGKEKYLQMADESLDFFMNYFVDHTYGEIYENRTRRGAETWGTTKANSGKAGYHSIETGFYTYLYGNLFVHKKPVTLYYKIDGVTEERVFRPTPLAANLDSLYIQSVNLNDEEYTNFNASEKTITLPQGTSGKFAVTFGIGGTTGINDTPVTPEVFALEQNYPNPFNSTTNIRFTLPKGEDVQVKIYDILGQEVATVANRFYSPGKHSLKVDMHGLSAGMYIYTIQAGEYNTSRKMIYLK